MSVPQWRAASDCGQTMSICPCWTCGQKHETEDPHLYDYKEEVDEDLMCHICLQPLVEPTDTPCGHTFCRSCLLNHLSFKSSCPIDRIALNPSSCQAASLMVRRLLDKLEVRCPNSPICQSYFPRCELEDHLCNRCHGAYQHCPQRCNGCQFHGPRKALQKHLSECPIRYASGANGNSIVHGAISRINVQCSETTLGISVVGGSDSPLRCIVIQEIHPEGSLLVDGRCQPGDQIVEVDGRDCTQCTHEQAVTLLRQSSKTIQLGIYRDLIEPHPQSLISPAEDFVLELKKQPGELLGIKLITRRQEPGVYVTELLEGSVAAADSRLRIDDRILEINSSDVRNSSLEDAMFLIQLAFPNVKLLVSRSASPVTTCQTSSSSLSATRQSPPVLPLPPRTYSPGHPAPSIATDNLDNARCRKHSPSSSEQCLQPKYFSINKGPQETLGVRVAGGLESQDGNTPVYVQNVNPYGCLGKSGMLKKGDVIISVNGTSLLGITHNEAVSILKAIMASTSITLGIIEGPEITLGQDPFFPTWIFWHKLPRCLHMSRSVTLHRSPSESLGFSLVGGRDSRHSNQSFHVLLVVQDSLAAKTGKLRCGDQILSVNGHRLDGLRHAEAVVLLKKSCSKVLIEILSWPGTRV